MPFPKIAAVATRDAASSVHAGARCSLLAGYADEERRGFFRRSDIDGRHLVDRSGHLPARRVGRRAQRSLPRAGALAPRRVGGAWRAGAGRLGRARASISSRPRRAPDVLTPSLDAHLISRLGCRPDIQRVHVGDTGCASAMVALQQAANHLHRVPGRRALVIAVEICSAAYYPGRPAGERGGARDLRRRRRARSPSPPAAGAVDRRRTGRSFTPSISAPWDSSIRAGGRA